MTKQSQPFGDVSAMMAQFKMPGLDMAAIVEARRKDIQALVDANTASMASMQALASKQTEMLNEAMQGMQEAAKGLVGGSAPPDMSKQGEILRQGFEKTLANMKELAEMAQQAQTEAMAKITQRASSQMEEIKAMIKPK